MILFRYGIALLSLSCLILPVAADEWEPNFDESQVPAYDLPDVLVMQDGSQVNTAQDWNERRRPELLDLFRREMYGFMPEVDRSKLRFEELARDDHALDGTATRKEVRIYFNWPEKLPKLDVLIYLPKSDQPVPAFLGLNFHGNHTTVKDPAVRLADNPPGTHAIPENERENQRGSVNGRWQVERVINRGYALVTAYYQEITPDQPEGRPYGVLPLFSDFETRRNLKTEERAASITAWAWGLSRILDYLETLPEIDSERVAVLGHSRLGKTALWAVANDPRFALVISNNSGCGGAALTRRDFGETIAFMDKNLTWWFCPNYRKYAENPGSLPFDQHALIALIAPRPVYVASAHEDHWADPKGEFLSAFHADPVYRLLGTNGIDGVTEWPQVGQPVGGTIHYHVRAGGHDVTEYDWLRYLDFADEYMK